MIRVGTGALGKIFRWRLWCSECGFARNHQDWCHSAGRVRVAA